MGNETKCFKDYQDESKCYTYFYNIFNDIRYYLYKYKDNVMVKKFNDGIYAIDKIDDPILRHIALYLVENYCTSKKYFREDGKWKDNPACDALNKWLDNKKSYFTHALHCQGNVHLWEKTIEPLWKKLVKESKENNNNWCNDHIGSKKKWCERNNYFRGNLKLPEELNRPRCYKHVPNEYECVRPFPPTKLNLVNTCKNLSVISYHEKCKNEGIDFSDFSSMFAEAIAKGNSPFKSIDDPTFSRQMQTHCECSSFQYATAISVSLSFIGTLLILFLLKKFTPLGSKLSYRGINKRGLRDNFNEELQYEEYARSMNKNPHRWHRRNNIYYDYVRN